MHQIQSFSKRVAGAVRALCVLAFVLIAGTAAAQVAGTGTIQGTIADSTGAVVPNATVTITNVSTGVKHTSPSDSSGIYVFPNLDIGAPTRSA